MPTDSELRVINKFVCDARVVRFDGESVCNEISSKFLVEEEGAF